MTSHGSPSPSEKNRRKVPRSARFLRRFCCLESPTVTPSVVMLASQDLQSGLMNPVGSVEPKLLSILATDAAVKLFRELLWAEAAEIGLGPSLISVPGAIT